MSLTMSASAAAVHALRTEHRARRHAAMMPRLWQAMRGEWERLQDRRTAQHVRRLGHDGVQEDYRAACAGH